MLKNKFLRMTNVFSLCVVACLSAVIFLSATAEASTRAEVQKWIIEEAKLTRVPPALALAVAKVESNFRDDALGSQGERGVMQIMPATARGEFGVSPGRLWNGRLNVNLGLRYLERLYNQYGGRWHLALSHYNGGTLKGRGANAIPHSYNRKYVADVLSWRNTFERRNLVAQIKRMVDAPNSSGASGGRPGVLPKNYWMLDDSEIERGWQHYVDVAAYWLTPEDERKRLDVQRHGFSRYADNRFQGGEYPVRGDSHFRPSDNWKRDVERIRVSFRRHIRDHEDPLELVSSWYHEDSEINSVESAEDRFPSRPSDVWKRNTERLRESFRRYLQGYRNPLDSDHSWFLERPVFSSDVSADEHFQWQS